MENRCQVRPEDIGTDHCMHRDEGDLVCCWCGDKFVDILDHIAASHGPFDPDAPEGKEEERTPTMIDQERLWLRLSHAAACWMRRSNADTRADLLSVAIEHGDDEYARGRRDGLSEVLEALGARPLPPPATRVARNLERSEIDALVRQILRDAQAQEEVDRE